MKDLYKRVIPEINSFYAQIDRMKDDVEKFSNVILRFDEVLTQKVDKFTFVEAQNNLPDFYLPKTEFKTAMNKIGQVEIAIVQHEEKVQSFFTAFKSDFKKDIQRQLNKMAANIQNSSVLDETTTSKTGEVPAIRQNQASVPREMQMLLNRKIDKKDVDILLFDYTSKETS